MTYHMPSPLCPPPAARCPGSAGTLEPLRWGDRNKLVPCRRSACRGRGGIGSHRRPSSATRRRRAPPRCSRSASNTYALLVTAADGCRRNRCRRWLRNRPAGPPRSGPSPVCASRSCRELRQGHDARDAVAELARRRLVGVRTPWRRRPPRPSAGWSRPDRPRGSSPGSCRSCRHWSTTSASVKTVIASRARTASVRDAIRVVPTAVVRVHDAVAGERAPQTRDASRPGRPTGRDPRGRPRRAVP